jgi:tetratricopeptide (TPR) repeat protein
LRPDYLKITRFCKTMSQETKDKVQPAIDIEGAFDKTEQYVDQNRKSIALVAGGIILVVAIFFAWKFLYQQPRGQEATAKMYKAESWFAVDSFNLAINGHGDTLGFAAIVDEYGSTKAGNLAKYYLGICYLRTGKFDQAIETLEDYDAEDMFTSSLSLGLIGDAHSEKGETDQAIDYYLKAAKKNPNKLTSPIFLKKAAFAYEDKGQKEEAIRLYEQIKTDFPDASDASTIDKYITRDGGTVK